MSNDQVRRHHDRVYEQNRSEVQARNGSQRAVAGAEVETRAEASRQQHAASGGQTSYADYLKSLQG